MNKARLLFFVVQIGVLGYVSVALGYIALLGILIGGDRLFSPSAYRTEHLAYFLLGVSGLLGLVGLWIATLARRWLHKKWLGYLTAALLVCGILCGASLLYFHFTLSTVTWKLSDFLAIGFIVLPIVWGVLLIRIVRNLIFKVEQA